VEGVEIKGVGSGWSRQTCQLHTVYCLWRINFINILLFNNQTSAVLFSLPLRLTVEWRQFDFIKKWTADCIFCPVSFTNVIILSSL